MRRGQRGQSVGVTFRVEPKLKAKVVEEAKRQERSVSDLGKIYLSWLAEKSEAAGSWDELQRLVSAAEALKPMADKEDRTLPDMLRVAVKWLAEEHKRAGTWERLKYRKGRTAADAEDEV